MHRNVETRTISNLCNIDSTSSPTYPACRRFNFYFINHSQARWKRWKSTSDWQHD